MGRPLQPERPWFPGRRSPGRSFSGLRQRPLDQCRRNERLCTCLRIRRRTTQQCSSCGWPVCFGFLEPLDLRAGLQGLERHRKRWLGWLHGTGHLLWSSGAVCTERVVECDGRMGPSYRLWHSGFRAAAKTVDNAAVWEASHHSRWSWRQGLIGGSQRP
jgi:hypothetical protein